MGVWTCSMSLLDLPPIPPWVSDYAMDHKKSVVSHDLSAFSYSHSLFAFRIMSRPALFLLTPLVPPFLQHTVNACLSEYTSESKFEEWKKTRGMALSGE